MTNFIAPFLGTGKDGAKVTSSNEDINAVRQSCTVTADTKSINVTDHSSYSDGDLVMVHKSRGSTNTGAFRFARVLSRAGNVLTVDRNIDIDFSDSSAEQSQCIQVPEFTSWKINSGFTVAPAPWDHNIGGVLVAFVQGSIIVEGSISAAGLGYFGGIGNNNSNSIATQGEGYAGAGSLGVSSANGNGGGAGRVAGPNPSGGGNGTAGGGANPGATAGSEDLTAIVFGGGGGGKGMDHPTQNDGTKGGGIIIIVFNRLVITGSISVNGANAQTNAAAGAGGSLLGIGNHASIGTNLITAIGGQGGNANGGNGRVRLNVGNLTGSTSQGSISVVKGGHAFLGRAGILS